MTAKRTAKRTARDKAGGDKGGGGAALAMDLVCSRCRECGKECGRLVRSGASGRDRRRSGGRGNSGGGGASGNSDKPLYCSDKCAARAAARARKAPADTDVWRPCSDWNDE